MKTAGTGTIDANRVKSLLWKGNVHKKSSNPSASFLCLGASEIQRRYLVNLDLDDVEYCKKNGLIGFTSDTSLVCLKNV
jgi:hypothetical protein